jgi:hypothetical protein
MQLLSSQARNNAADASSSGPPKRPRGNQLSELLLCDSHLLLCLELPSTSSVSVARGLRVLTRMGRSFSSTARERANDCNAALISPYTGIADAQKVHTGGDNSD